MTVTRDDAAVRLARIARLLRELKYQSTASRDEALVATKHLLKEARQHHADAKAAYERNKRRIQRHGDWRRLLS